MPLLLSSVRIIQPVRFHWNAMTANEMYYGFLMAALTLFLTLLQAVLLWTELDMEQEM
ncbi:MAG TPA: hypothetical protein VGT08_09240 [Terracidiphilus sp.]|nr:hypothetical protein [Terracidiphilus sp.]